MDRNIKIAKELVRIARALVADNEISKEQKKEIEKELEKNENKILKESPEKGLEDLAEILQVDANELKKLANIGYGRRILVADKEYGELKDEFTPDMEDSMTDKSERENFVKMINLKKEDFFINDKFSICCKNRQYQSKPVAIEDWSSVRKLKNNKGASFLDVRNKYLCSHFADLPEEYTAYIARLCQEVISQMAKDKNKKLYQKYIAEIGELDEKARKQREDFFFNLKKSIIKTYRYSMNHKWEAFLGAVTLLLSVFIKYRIEKSKKDTRTRLYAEEFERQLKSIDLKDMNGSDAATKIMDIVDSASHACAKIEGHQELLSETNDKK